MKGYVVVRVIGAQVYGQRFNGQYSYYCATHGSEVFFSKHDAEAVAEDYPDSKCHIIHVNIPELVQPSLGAAIVRWAKKVCDREGYYPSVKSAKAKLRELMDKHDGQALRAVRNLTTSNPDVR